MELGAVLSQLHTAMTAKGVRLTGAGTISISCFRSSMFLVKNDGLPRQARHNRAKNSKRGRISAGYWADSPMEYSANFPCKTPAPTPQCRPGPAGSGYEKLARTRRGRFGSLLM
jgi:hypothetical protein